MEDLRTLETSQLIDLLAKYTSDYTKMMTGNISNEEYEKYKLTIKAIQSEIDSRRGTETPYTIPPPEFS